MKKGKYEIRFLEFIHIVIAVMIIIVCILFLFDISHVLVCYPVAFFLFAAMCGCMALENSWKIDGKNWMIYIYISMGVFFVLITIISGVQLL